MGVSTDGILAYGVDLGEHDDLELPWIHDNADDEEENDFDSWYVGLHCLSSDSLWEQFYEWERTEGGNVPNNQRIKHYEEIHPEWREALNDFYEKSNAIKKDAPIEIVYHCSGDYPMTIVAVSGTVARAWRGEPQIVEGWDVHGEKVEAAAAFCAEHNIPFENPNWLLASYWG